MARDTLPTDIYQVVKRRYAEIEKMDKAEVDFLCRETATELSALVMEHFHDTLANHLQDLKRRDEKVAYEREARGRAEQRSAEARAIIEAAGNTPPHEWSSWEERAQTWLDGQSSSAQDRNPSLTLHGS